MTKKLHNAVLLAKIAYHATNINPTPQMLFEKVIKLLR